MSVAQSLYTGVTGLSVNADYMSVVANNIANANSKGFKRDRVEFADILTASTLQSGGEAAKIGKGARVGRVKTMHTQGGMQITDNLTDIAIQGAGFFVVTKPGASELDMSDHYFTRVGALGFDKDGFLADPKGGRIQGYMADAAGQLSSRLSDIRIETNTLPPRATENLLLNVQLDSRMTIIPEDFDVINPEKTSNFATSAAVFDSNGREHLMTMYFKKTEDAGGGSTWQWYATVDKEEVTDPPSEGELQVVGSGEIVFDKFGFLNAEEPGDVSINFSNGAFPEQKIAIDFGRNTGVEEGKGVNTSTAIAGKSSMIFHQQDGFESGELKSLDIDRSGEIRGVFTNGIQKSLAGIALATFANEDGLNKTGDNEFVKTIASGPANIGMPSTGMRGEVFSSTLEESNVDLARQFVEMIRAQRMFQANSRSITTSDSMFEEVIGLKR